MNVPPSEMACRCVLPDTGYIALLQNIAAELAAMGKLDEVASAIADWRMRWIRSNPFA